jgi:hypothetical protein
MLRLKLSSTCLLHGGRRFYAWAAVCAVAAVVVPLTDLGARPALAIIINLTYDNSEAEEPCWGPNGNCATSTSWDPGGFVLMDHARAAADIWESLLNDPTTYNIEIEWDNNFTPPTIGQWTSGGYIEVNSAAGVQWFTDPTPGEHSEFNFANPATPSMLTQGQTLYRDLSLNSQQTWFPGNPPPSVLEVGFRGTSVGGGVIGASGFSSTDSNDLLSLLLHEMGHHLGFNGVNGEPDGIWEIYPQHLGLLHGVEVGESSFSNSHLPFGGPWVMSPAAPPGVRILPSATDVLIAAEEQSIANVTLARVDAITSGPWHFPQLWIGGRVPGASQDAFIRDANGQVTLSANAVARSLTIDGEPHFVKTNNFKLTATGGTTTVTHGQIIVDTGGQVELAALDLNGHGELTMDGGFAWIHGPVNIIDDPTLPGPGIAAIQGHGEVRIDGNFGRLVNNGRIRADGGTLTIRRAPQPLTLTWDLDGDAVVESGSIHAIDGDLHLDIQTAFGDDFDGEMLIGNSHNVTLTSIWTLGAAGLMHMQTPGQTPGDATLSAPLTHVKGKIIVDGRAVIDSDVVFWLTAEVLVQNSDSRLRLDGLTTYYGGKFEGGGVLDQLGSAHVEQSTTIDVDTYNWDGSNEPNYTRIWPEKIFTINSHVIEESGGGYAGDILIEGGTLEVNTKQLDEDTGSYITAPWKLDLTGEMHLLNSRFWLETDAGVGARVRGAPIDISGRVLGKGEENRILSAVVFRSNALVEVPDATDELQFAGPIEYHGGIYRGDGTIRQIGDAVFHQYWTTIQPKIYDWDGLEAAPSTTTIGPQVTAFLRPESIDTDGGFGGLVQITKGRLIVNTHSHPPVAPANLPWTLDEGGTIDLLGEARVSGTDDPSITLYNPNGSRMIVAGQINASGPDNVIYSPTTFRPPARVNVNTGGTLILDAPTRYEGGSYMGNGVLVQNLNAIVAAPTTISTRTFDFDGQFEATEWTLESDLTLNVDQLDVAGNVFDGTIFAHNGSASLRVDLGAATGAAGWEMRGNLAVGMASAAELHIDGVPVKLSGTVIVGTGSTLVFDADVCGNTQFTGGGTVVFNGANSPGCSPGVQEFEGNVEFGRSAVLTMELASPRPEDYDRLEIAGQATFGGTLRVETLGRFVPAPGDRFAILSYGRARGAFDRLEASGAADGMMFVPDFDGRELTLAYTVLGDVNASSSVDRTDAAVMAANFGMKQGATSAHGDLDGDGAVGMTDLALFQANFRRSVATSPATSQAAVPEPSSIALCLVALTATLFFGHNMKRDRANEHDLRAAKNGKCQ